MVKLRIEVEADECMEAIGISSSYSDYRLAWTFNNVFNWQFFFSEVPLVIPAKKSTESRSYYYYQYLDEMEKMHLFLVKNKQGGKALFEDYPQFDFVLFFKNNLSFDVNQWLILLRELDAVFAAYRCSSNDFSIASLLHFESNHE